MTRFTAVSGEMPFTSRISMLAVAVEGITLLAPAPVRELLMPRMFSDGRLISSTSFFPAPSVRPSDSSRIRSASTSGASAMARFSVSVSGSMPS